MKRVGFLLLIVLLVMPGIVAARPDERRAIWKPAPGTTWQIQLNQPINMGFDVEVYDVDLFDTPKSTIKTLHTRGRRVVCYFSAGSLEDWRPDAKKFPSSVRGDPLAGWPGEYWLDIRRMSILKPIMEARLDLAVRKGCDGVDPDNVTAFEARTGFPLTYNHQLNYNRWLARAAHARGLSIGLKNDVAQIKDLESYFDFTVNEECFVWQECKRLMPFIRDGKAVFAIEYDLNPAVICPQANQRKFSMIFKRRNLFAPVLVACWDYP